MSLGHMVVCMTIMPKNPKDLQNSTRGMWLRLGLKIVYVGAKGTGVVEEVILPHIYSPSDALIK